MTISEEQRNALIAQVNASEINAEAKQHILGLLAAPELSSDSLDEIVRLIQSDIDTDIETVAPGLLAEMANDPAEQAAMKDTEDHIKAVADDLDDSMAFVEKTSRELEGAADVLGQADTEMRASDLKAKMGIGS